MSFAKIHERHESARKEARKAFRKRAPERYCDFSRVRTYTNAPAEYMERVRPLQDYIRITSEEAGALADALRAANEAYNFARQDGDASRAERRVTLHRFDVEENISYLLLGAPLMVLLFTFAPWTLGGAAYFLAGAGVGMWAMWGFFVWLIYQNQKCAA